MDSSHSNTKTRAQSTSPAARLEQLRGEIKTLEDAMARCDHAFSAPVSVSRPAYEYIFDHYAPHGSDPEPIFQMVEKKEYGFERTCAKCGKTQYTTKTRPIIQGYTADFGQ